MPAHPTWLISSVFPSAPMACSGLGRKVCVSPAQDQVKSRNLSSQPLVADLIGIVAVTQVRKADDQVAVFGCAQVVGHFLSFFHRIEVFGISKIAVAHQAIQLNTNTENSNSNFLFIKHLIRLISSL